MLSACDECFFLIFVLGYPNFDLACIYEQAVRPYDQVSHQELRG